MPRGIYESFAALLQYPGQDYHALIWRCLSRVPSECAEDVSAFAATALGMNATQAQENFTAAFDMNPKCALELGWHLLGERYERGVLLVRMRELLRKYGVPESKELPDHLTHALLLLACMSYGEANDFACAIVLPALERLLVAMKEGGNPYEPLVRAIDRFLRLEYPQTADDPASLSLAVLQGVEQ